MRFLFPFRITNLFLLQRSSKCVSVSFSFAVFMNCQNKIKDEIKIYENKLPDPDFLPAFPHSFLFFLPLFLLFLVPFPLFPFLCSFSFFPFPLFLSSVVSLTFLLLCSFPLPLFFFLSSLSFPLFLSFPSFSFLFLTFFLLYLFPFSLSFYVPFLFLPVSVPFLLQNYEIKKW